MCPSQAEQEQLEEDVRAIRGVKQTTLDTYFATQAQISAAHNLLALAIVEGCGSVPLNFCESARIAELLALFGVPPLTRRVLAGPVLQKLYEECLKEAIKALKSGKLFQVTAVLLTVVTTGWCTEDLQRYAHLYCQVEILGAVD